MSITFRDNSGQVLAAMDRSIGVCLSRIGIAAKHSIQNIIVQKDIYDTGELHRTIDYNTRTADKAVDIGSPKNYAVFQELGTVRQKARPFIMPGIMNNINEYEDIAFDTFGRTFKVSAGSLSTRSKYYQNSTEVTNI